VYTVQHDLQMRVLLVCELRVSYRLRASEEAIELVNGRGNAMKFGVMMFTTDYSMTPMELATAAEDRGFESLWFPEHSHIPLTRKSP